MEMLNLWRNLAKFAIHCLKFWHITNQGQYLLRPVAMYQDPTLQSYQAAHFYEFKRGLKASLPVVIGLLPFGLLLGTEAAQKGLSSIELSTMTALNFGGGSEFAAMAIWTSPPNLLLILAVTFLVNSRHLLMGLTFAPHLRHLPLHKALFALFFMVDESWAIALDDAKKSGRLNLGFYAGIALALWVVWAGSTTLGGIIGPALGDVTRFGFDMAFPAVFLVMLSGMWKGTQTAYPWLVSLIFAAGASILLPGAWYVPIGAVSGVLCSYLMTKAQDA